MLTTKLTIEEVEAEFAIWRSTKKLNSPAPIPDSLCNQVRLLLQDFPQREVLKRCGMTLNQARLKGLLPQTDTIHQAFAAQESNHFVKISMPHVAAKPSGMLTLHHGESHLSLDNPSNEQLQIILESLLR